MTPPSDTDVRELVVPLNDAQMGALDTLVRIGIYGDNVGEVATFLIMRELQDLHGTNILDSVESPAPHLFRNATACQRVLTIVPSRTTRLVARTQRIVLGGGQMTFKKVFGVAI